MIASKEQKLNEQNIRIKEFEDKHGEVSQEPNEYTDFTIMDINKVPVNTLEQIMKKSIKVRSHLRSIYKTETRI
jgi:hypothetical protein